MNSFYNIELTCFYYRAEPHYGWADVVGNSTQLLSIQPRERPPGVFPSMDFGPSLPPEDELPPNSSQWQDDFVLETRLMLNVGSLANFLILIVIGNSQCSKTYFAYSFVSFF